MKKKLAAGVLSVVLLVGGATVAYGTDIDTSKIAEMKVLNQQISELHKKFVEKGVEAGLFTQQQADAKKKFIDQHQELSTKALDEGKVLDPSLRKGMDKGMFNKGMREGKAFNNGEPMTSEQIATWLEQANTRLKAQVEAMTKNGKLTTEQIETWRDKAEAQLKAQAEAMANGTFAPGNMGMGKAMRGNPRGGAFGGVAPVEPATTDTNTQ